MCPSNRNSLLLRVQIKGGFLRAKLIRDIGAKKVLTVEHVPG